MTMGLEKNQRKKRTKSLAPYAYNLNDFPDEVLGRIISFLPTKEAVCTSILSRRWRYLFLLISNLDLQFDYDDKGKLDRFLNFVDRLLVLCREKPSLVVRFHLHCRGIFIDPKRVLPWICALVELKIEELVLCIGNKFAEIRSGREFEFGVFPLPASLFSCESLVVLKLELHSEYDLRVPALICLPNVKVIDLKRIWFSKDACEGTLFSSCPILEDLVFDECWFSKNCSKFIVSNQNLKRLTLGDMKTIVKSTVPITLNAPSLVVLNYTLNANLPLVLLDVTSSLAKAYIDGATNMSELEVDAAANVLRGIQNVTTLEIHNSIIRDLHRHNVRIPVFDKMTWLKLCGWGNLFDPICLEYFLARCVALETLVIEDISDSSPTKLDNGIKYSLRKSLLAPLLDRLKKIEIQVQVIEEDKDEDVMAVIEFFLKNATVLEEVKISWKCRCYIRQFEIMTRLLSFPRVSKECRVLC